MHDPKKLKLLWDIKVAIEKLNNLRNVKLLN